MRAVVVYESMYGNTHRIADEIGAGLREAPGVDEVAVVSVHEADEALQAGVDLLVVGGPTHVHGMSHERTRDDAVRQAEEPDSGLRLDPDAEGSGLREWFDALHRLDVPAAAFDTRIDLPVALTGRASKGIARRLRKLHCDEVAVAHSFLVTTETELEPDEALHAHRWGSALAAASAGHRGRGVRSAPALAAIKVNLRIAMSLSRATSRGFAAMVHRRCITTARRCVADSLVNRLSRRTPSPLRAA